MADIGNKNPTNPFNNLPGGYIGLTFTWNGGDKKPQMDLLTGYNPDGSGVGGTGTYNLDTGNFNLGINYPGPIGNGTGTIGISNNGLNGSVTGPIGSGTGTVGISNDGLNGSVTGPIGSGTVSGSAKFNGTSEGGLNISISYNEVGASVGIKSNGDLSADVSAKNYNGETTTIGLTVPDSNAPLSMTVQAKGETGKISRDKDDLTPEAPPPQTESFFQGDIDGGSNTGDSGDDVNSFDDLNIFGDFDSLDPVNSFDDPKVRIFDDFDFISPAPISAYPDWQDSWQGTFDEGIDWRKDIKDDWELDYILYHLQEFVC